MVQNNDVAVVGTDPSGLIAAHMLLSRKQSVNIIYDYDELDVNTWVLMNGYQLRIYGNMFGSNFCGLHAINAINYRGVHKVKNLYAIRLYDMSTVMLNKLIEMDAKLIPCKIDSLNLKHNIILTDTGRLILFGHIIANDGFHSVVAEKIYGNDKHLTLDESKLYMKSELVKSVRGNNIEPETLNVFSEHNQRLVYPVRRPAIQHNWSYLVGSAAGFYDPVFGISMLYEIHCAGAAVKCIVSEGSYKNIVNWVHSDMKLRYRLRRLPRVYIKMEEEV